MVSGVNSLTKVDSNKAVSAKIDDNKKAVSYRQTHKQIA